MGQGQEASREDRQPGTYASRPLSVGSLSILVHDDRMIKLRKSQQKLRTAKHRQPSRRKQDRLFQRCCRSQEARRVGTGQWEDTQGAGLGARAARRHLARHTQPQFLLVDNPVTYTQLQMGW